MDDTRLRNPEQCSASTTILLALLVLAAAAVCLWRGPIRAVNNPSDFVLVYGPTRAWLAGENPYDGEAAKRAWIEAGAVEHHGSRIEEGLFYPPSTLVLVAPFAVLPWPLAHRVWLAANLVFLALTLWCITRLLGFGTRQRRTWLFVAASLVFAPVHTTLHHGQTPLFVMALMLPAFLIRSSAASGSLLGLASALKPQLGLPFAALQIVRERWRSAIIGAIVLGLILTIAVLPMSMRSIGWFEQWQANLEASFASGPTSFEAQNLYRHHMINLQYPLVALTEHARVSGIAALIICAALAAVFFLPPRARMARTSLVAALSMVAVLTLMVAYHRFYDAVLLLIPLAWAIDRVARRDGAIIAWCVLALLIPFFLNSATALKWLENNGRLPGWLVQSWCWDRMIMPHLGWALLAMALCLIIEQRRSKMQSAPCSRHSG